MQNSMTQNSSVSVVIPAFNAGKYIKACLDSLISQTYKEIEIIVINDGSTDNTAEILREFESRDSRIKVITQENSGVSAARNRGIKESYGKYIMFVDSDDYLISDTAIEELICRAEKDDIDIIAFGSLHEDGNGISYEDRFTQEELIVKSSDILYAVGKTITNSKYRTSVWNKFIKAALIKENNLKFYGYDIVISEDKVMNANLFAFAEKILLLPKVYYRYTIVNGSLSHQKVYSNVLERNVKTFEYIYEGFFMLQDSIRKSIMFYFYCDCLSCIAELFYRVNGRSFKYTISQMKLFISQIYKNTDYTLKGTVCSRKIICNRQKYLFFRTVFFLVLNKMEVPASAIVLFKSFIRRKMGVRN